MRSVSIFLFILFTVFPAQSQVVERSVVPIAVKEDAARAVQELAREVMKGNFLYSLDKMYPRWKARAARQVGGMDVLTKRLESVPQEMQRKGINILDFRVSAPSTAYEVNGTILNNSGTRKIHFSEYLVLVPTTTLYRAIDPNGGVVKKLESKGFQIAVAKKGTTNWSFIDGTSTDFNELRGLFPFLPDADKAMKFPETGMREL